MKKLLVALVVVVATLANPSSARAGGCTAGASLDSSTASCTTEGQTSTEPVSASSSNTIYQARIMCSNEAGEGLCSNPDYCAAPPGSIRHTIYRSDDGGQTFAEVSEACLLPEEIPEGGPPVLTPNDVAAAFAEIDWPQSPLTIQPPGGRTLVNLETNFLTTNTAPTSQTVTLLGQQVEIEATPSSWTWQHGDGTSQTTSEPGTAYPDLTITHTYLDADTTADVSVDTTYTGRYRVNGGPWTAIPVTRTITGVAAALEIVPATPQLVGAQ